jgi:hypothetical protein
LQEFEDIYNKEISKKYHNYRLKRLSKRKNRKRDIGAGGRLFKLDVKDRFIILLLVYYRLYIPSALAGFLLFDLDQSSICRDIQKIETLIMECVLILQKIFPITKRLESPEEVEHYFPAGFLAFTDCTEQQQIATKPVDKNRRKIFYSGKKKKKTYCKE